MVSAGDIHPSGGIGPTCGLARPGGPPDYFNRSRVSISFVFNIGMASVEPVPVILLFPGYFYFRY